MNHTSSWYNCEVFGCLHGVLPFQDYLFIIGLSFWTVSSLFLDWLWTVRWKRLQSISLSWALFWIPCFSHLRRIREKMLEPHAARLISARNLLRIFYRQSEEAAHTGVRFNSSTFSLFHHNLPFSTRTSVFWCGRSIYHSSVTAKWRNSVVTSS